jgi:hypothetical protein
MSIITLTTDWNRNDFYVGALKGALLQKCHNGQIVDISHQIQPFNIAQSAFVLRNSYSFFPKGSIHIIGVSTDLALFERYLAVKAHGHYFIGADNGVFGLILQNDIEKAVEIDLTENEKPGTFPELYIFAEATAHIFKKHELAKLGKPAEDVKKQIPLRATVDEAGITGGVIYIDSYKNAITNISKHFFEEAIGDKRYEILVQSNHYKIRGVSSNYGDVPVGELVAVFNSVDLLEIAINNGNAAELLNLTTNSNVRIRFIDKNK